MLQAGAVVVVRVVVVAVPPPFCLQVAVRQLQACKAQSLELQAELGTCRNQIAELQRQMKVSCLLMLGCSSQVQIRPPMSCS